MGRQLFATAHHSGQFLACLVEAYPQYSKDRLFSFVLCGNVKVNEETVKDHTRTIKKDSVIILYDEDIDDTEDDNFDMFSVPKNYVSRGGDKLCPVLDGLDIEVAGKIWLDCGCATGGFTQCLLNKNALYVHAVDIAYNTLDYMMRIDSRVIVHEKTNVLSISMLDPEPQRAVADLSFRSLRGIAGHIIRLCEEKYLLALCKPQFEYVAYMKKIKGDSFSPSDAITSKDAQSATMYEQEYEKNFDGVLRDTHILGKVLNDLLQDLLKEGVGVLNIIPAGIKGKRGNQEYFLELVEVRKDDIHVDFPTKKIERNELLTQYQTKITEVIERY